MAYHTLHERFGRLPSGLTVLPGHVHVEPDGTWATGRPGTLVAATLGDVLDGLAPYGLDEPAFVDRVTSDLPEKPANYERVIRINRGVDEAADETEDISLETGRNNCAV
ncbi:hypothetical protein ACFQRB_19780 [Halobaculum litoreum]|uniref:Uncharacterized protein n=1 Tax=Halobaculum litoreum TaxID=3031998 RepID=A0ABD5XY34_9EURY